MLENSNKVGKYYIKEINQVENLFKNRLTQTRKDK